jgi:ABC-type amino acid transport substrate-binding protein
MVMLPVHYYRGRYSGGEAEMNKLVDFGVVAEWLRARLPYFLLLLVAGCHGESPELTLRIASDATFPPFHVVDENGSVTGFDIELARAIATQAGFQPEVVVLAYDKLFSGLMDKSHDVVAATTGITPERQKKYLFGDAYFDTCQVAVVRVGEAEPAVLADLRNLRIGASGSGTSAAAMRTLDGRHIEVDSGQGVAVLQADDIDAWIVDEFDGVAAARASAGRLAVLPQGVAGERYGLVFAAGRLETKMQLDAALDELRQNGTLRKLQGEFGLSRGPGWPVVCPVIP